MIKRLAALLALAGVALAVAGCNTVEGMGKDLQALGHAVSGAAQ